MLLSLLLASTFLFKGGSDSALVDAVSGPTGRSICYLLSPRRTWPKANFDFVGRNELELVLRRRYDLGLSESSEQRSAWSVGEYPGAFFYKQNENTYVETAPSLPLPRLSWPLSVTTTQIRYLTMAQIEKLSNKSLTVHWFFREARLSASVRNQSEADFLEVVAKSVGGRLTKKQEGWLIDLDPRAFRKKARKLFDDQLEVAPSVADALDAKYLAALYDALTDAQIQKVYEKPNNSMDVHVVAGSDLERLAAARLWQRIGPPDADDVTLPKDQADQRKYVLSRADFSQGFWADANSNGVPTCRLKAKGGGWCVTY